MALAALAIGTGAALYMIDTQRDQILRYLPTTGFSVVAGDGAVGHSPDGTPARHARLDLSWASGLTVDSNGIIYFTEGDQVRDVRRDGTIGTIAGGGTVKMARRPVAALRADLAGVAGLALGPAGDVYVGTDQGVYRLGRDDELHWVVGEPYPSPLPPHWGGVYSNPATQNDFAYAVHLAFDSGGNLFVAGGGAYGLYEQASSGRLRFIEVLRGQGGLSGSLATTPDGAVITASGRGLQRIGPSQKVSLVRAAWPQKVGPGHAAFCACFGVGVAVGPLGQIYVDTDQGDAIPNQGLYEVMPTGRVLSLWVAPD